MRSASRNSATVFASTPALRAPRDAVRAVVFAALRAFCWRPRACPPFLAAAVRFAAVDRELDEDRELDVDRALEERLRLDADLAAEERPPDDLLPEALLLDAGLPEALLLDARPPEERFDALDFDLPPEPPLLRRSAMSRSPS